MTFFDVLTMIGGMSLFLFGMNVMAMLWNAAPATACAPCLAN